ncbi:unnamed protein product, partial [Amoebophrya sp. A25]
IEAVVGRLVFSSYLCTNKIHEETFLDLLVAAPG